MTTAKTIRMKRHRAAKSCASYSTPNSYGARPVVTNVGHGIPPFVNVGSSPMPIAAGDFWGGGAWSVLGPAAIGAAAYHGYKRNHSAGWAIVWALCATVSPIITVAVAVAEGFGKAKRAS